MSKPANRYDKTVHHSVLTLNNNVIADESFKYFLAFKFDTSANI